MARNLTVGIGGFGAVGRKVAEALDAGVEGLELKAISARDHAKARANMAAFKREVPVVSLGNLADCDIVVEGLPAAGKILHSILAAPIVLTAAATLGGQTESGGLGRSDKDLRLDPGAVRFDQHGDHRAICVLGECPACDELHEDFVADLDLAVVDLEIQVGRACRERGARRRFWGLGLRGGRRCLDWWRRGSACPHAEQHHEPRPPHRSNANTCC